MAAGVEWLVRVRRRGGAARQARVAVKAHGHQRKAPIATATTIRTARPNTTTTTPTTTTTTDARAITTVAAAATADIVTAATIITTNTRGTTAIIANVHLGTAVVAATARTGLTIVGEERRAEGLPPVDVDGYVGGVKCGLDGDGGGCL